ncbi:MAG: hypothetical protein COW65_13095 [Cytophagales bacterium CG18_big_fil_WC_8_21_14_2_50_42_9]|nr:MAG: hypothetical protein COW65_13095 [Cytophagales bacterium CG18_big_fil_WC_8_21_14_2_50_42_9]
MHPNIRSKVTFLLSLFWFLILLGATVEKASATHIRAGEITAHPDTTSGNNPLRYFFKLVVYTESARTDAQNPEATLFFGTGESQTSDRNGPYATRDPDTKRNVYYFDYIYPAPGTYQITYAEVNRQTGVVNIANSAGQSFLLRTTITIDPFLGVNSTPQLPVPPIDYAACGQVFVHNPGAYDTDGDRLVYRLVTPLKDQFPDDASKTLAVPVDGYRELNDPSICQGSANAGAGTLTMDPNTGQLTWDAPCLQGDYNVAFVVEEYRNGRKLGEVMRDMQVRVRCVPNLRPTLIMPEDICVIAGETVNGVVTASDPDNNPVVLEAFSEFGVLPPATFTQSGNTGTFNWKTTCEDVLRDTVQVIFKVTDVVPNGGTPLTDLQPWRIRIVGPPPQNFKVLPTGNSINLSWNPYTCQNAKRIAIYRHEGPSDFVPGPCETGIPASAGFTRIGEVDLNTLTFTDTGGAEGFKRGVSYCYAIYAEFEGGNYRVIPGIATLPVCVMLQNNVPVITNVSIETTSETNGTVLVRWIKPREGLENLTPPQQYRLYRAPGDSPEIYTEVYRTNNVNDTTFIDHIGTTVGTATLKWIYKLEFYHNAAVSPAIVDTAATASSVQLKATTRSTSVNLTWNYQVPWDNTKFKHYIYRRADAGAYALIDSVSATANAGQYTDQGTFGNAPLVPGINYCYYVETRGGYDDPTLPKLLLNKSQEFCVVLKDSVPPCPPVLSIDPLDCESFLRNPTSPPYQNVLTWVPDQSPECDQNIAYFTIYYRPSEEGEFDSIAYTNGDINTYLHQNLLSFAGCYTVSATDTAGNESAMSNIVCKENCFFFQLPNIFTPNGDGKNDEFRPDRRSQFIKSVKFTVFTRWGDKVYESTDDPGINWTGVNNAGKQVSDGTYYYTAEVEFQSLSPQNAKQTFKGWVEIVR